MDLPSLIFDPHGPWGLNRDLALNLIADGIGAVSGAVLTTLLVERFRQWRHRAGWRPVRQSFARRCGYPHRIMLGHFEVLRAALDDGRAAGVDHAAFRAHMAATREKLERHIARFAHASDAPISAAADAYRRIFSYVVGISEDLAQGRPVVVRWRSEDAPPRGVFSGAHRALMDLWRLCDLLSRVPRKDLDELAARAAALDAAFAGLISIQRRSPGYLRDRMDDLDPAALVPPGKPAARAGAAADPVAEAVAFAAARHAAQTDKQGEPYIWHVLDVAGRVKALGQPYVVTALLHDVLEDTATSRQEVAAGFGPAVAAAVDALTRRSGEDYFDAYLPRVLADPIATRVKMADLEANMARLGGLSEPAERQRLQEKYRRAAAMVAAARGGDRADA